MFVWVDRYLNSVLCTRVVSRTATAWTQRSVHAPSAGWKCLAAEGKPAENSSRTIHIWNDFVPNPKNSQRTDVALIAEIWPTGDRVSGQDRSGDGSDASFSLPRSSFAVVLEPSGGRAIVDFESGDVAYLGGVSSSALSISQTNENVYEVRYLHEIEVSLKGQ